MAGMLAARVLSEHFDEVILLERDQYPENATPREGVPQARHLHALLARGHQIVEDLFPGISEDWCQAGGEFLDVGKDFAWRTPKGWGVRFLSGIRMLAGSRPLIDLVIRRRLEDVRNVAVVESAMVDTLTASDSRDRVTGVTVRTPGGEVQQLEADLVVEASGRMSRAPEWLCALGYQPPRESVVNCPSRVCHAPVPAHTQPGGLEGIVRPGCATRPDAGGHCISYRGRPLDRDGVRRRRGPRSAGRTRLS
jgi:hypothetical protein